MIRGLLPFMSGKPSVYAMDPSGHQYEIQAVPMTDGSWTYRVLGTGQKRVSEEREREVFEMISRRWVPAAPREPISGADQLAANYPAKPDSSLA